jgi:integrase
MPRPSHPWWWEERGRWAVNVKGKRHVAPDVLGRDDWLAARDWHARLMEELQPGSIRKPGVMTIQDIAEAYLSWDGERVAAKERSKYGHESIVTTLSLYCDTRLDGKRIGDRLAAKFTGSDMDRAISAWRKDDRAPGYIVAIVSGVKAMWAWARRPISGRVPERFIAENPLDGFARPPTPQADPRFATRPEAAAWLRWLRSRDVERSFILIQRALIHSGARPSEMIRARWRDVDWDGWTTDRGHVGAKIVLQKWKNARKTGKRRRILLMPSIRRSLLNTVGRQGPTDETPLFTHAGGGAWSSAVVLGNRVTRQRKAAIRDDEANNRTPRFRDEGADKLVNYRWRHTAASELLMRGIDIPTVAELLGTSPEMIQRTYGHLLDEHLARAASKLNSRR